MGIDRLKIFMANKAFELPDYLKNLQTFANNVKLGASTLGSGELQWPIGLGFDYMQIDIVEFVKTTDLQFAATGFDSAASTSGEQSKEGESAVGPDVSDITTPTSFLSNIQGQKTDTEKLATILLPVPNNLQFADNPNYKTGEGVVAKILPGIAKGIVNKEEAGNIASNLGALAAGGKIGLAMSALDKIVPGGGGANQITQAGFGKIMNPYTEQVFNGVGMRQFSFDWKLVPRNSKETANIKKIIKTLRAYSLPDYASKLGLVENNELGDSGNLSDRWLTVPKIFRIGWKDGKTNQTIDALPQLKPCVLTSVTINYTPDNVWATYEGADPVAYSMTLNFTETEIITSSEVANLGY